MEARSKFSLQHFWQIKKLLLLYLLPGVISRDFKERLSNILHITEQADHNAEFQDIVVVGL
jgi:hypothetical protein